VPLGRVFSPAVRLRGWKSSKSQVEVRRANACDYVLQQLARRQFAPAQLLVGDFYVAYEGNRIVGALAAWDQGAFKQTRVIRYHGSMRLLRRIARYPPAGETLRSFYVSYVAVDDADVYRALLNRVVEDYRDRGYHYFIAGAHERDPLLRVLENLPLTPFWARAFAVHFDDGVEEFAKLDDRVPYVELATL
jgi:hypothetical protein